MRILAIAPFARDEKFGGSLRGAAIAERLEERGADVVWHSLPARDRRALERLSAPLSPKPLLVRQPREQVRAPAGPWDAVVSVHSYMAEHAAALAGPRGVSAIDFQDLAWRHLRDFAEAGGRARAPYLQLQSVLMKRFERQLIRATPVSLFATRSDLEWGETAGGASRKLLGPNILVHEEASAADAIWRRRVQGAERGPLVYVGKLTYLPNVDALLAFLESTWPAVLEAEPDTRLSLIGECDAPLRRHLQGVKGVQALGFVEDLTEALSRATAALLPYRARAGSSVRTLFYALSGVPVIGSAEAFRGLPFPVGAQADTPAEWVAAIRLHLGDVVGPERAAADARRDALLLQRDPEPWDAFFGALRSAAA